MLKQRIITACVLVPLVVAAIVWLPHAALAAVAGLVFVVAFDEWMMLSDLPALAVRLPLNLVLAAILTCLFLAQVPWVLPAILALGCLWWLLSLAWLGNPTLAAAPTRSNSLAKALVGLVVITPAWAGLVWLHGHGVYGSWLLAALVLVWVADIGAYFVGRRFGRRKLAPRISPGKTRAGVAGALVCTLLLAVAVGWLFELPPPAWGALVVLTVIATAFSVVGDLVESLLKRQAMVKDSGTVFPGHGGLFDRIDSVCAFLPFFALGVWLLQL